MQFSILEVIFQLYIRGYQRKYFCSFASLLSIFVGSLFILISIYVSSFNLPLPLLCKIKVFQVEKIMLL